MKILFPFTALLLIVLSCNNTGDTKTENPKAIQKEKQKFFPVTSFIKGEIYLIKKNGVNPLKYTTINSHTDSVWLKFEELDAAFKEFLQPEIDTANLITLFTENNFLDQSINAITFTYEASAPLPDTMELLNWDVYLDPGTNSVKRIYLVKQVDKSTQMQLTWITGKWCKITTIVTGNNGISKVEKEEKITWDF